MANIRIQLAQILTDYPEERTYGEPFDFYIGSTTEDFFYDHYDGRKFKIDADKVTAGTNLRDTEMYVNEGSVYQAFENGVELGFCISCVCKGNGNNWKEVWTLTREENDLGIVYISELLSDYNNPLYLINPFKMTAPTLSGVLNKMKAYDDDELKNLDYKFANSNYAALSFIGYRDDDHTVFSTGGSGANPLYYIGLTEYNAWEMLITGKYPKDMYRMNIQTEDGYNIILGKTYTGTKITEESEGKVTYCMKKYIPGTSLGWLRERYGDIIPLKNGSYIRFDKATEDVYNTVGFVTIYKFGTETEELNRYEMKTKIGVYAYEDSHYFPHYTFSYFKYLRGKLEKDKLGRYGTITPFEFYNYQFMLSPIYNTVRAEDFENVIKEKTSDDWTSLWDRIITVCGTIGAGFSDMDGYIKTAFSLDQVTEFNRTSVWSEVPVQGGFRDIFTISTNSEWGGNINIDTSDKWLYLLDIAPTPIDPETPESGEGSLGGGGNRKGGNGKFNDKSDAIWDFDAFGGIGNNENFTVYYTNDDGGAKTWVLNSLGAFLSSDGIFNDYSKYTSAIISVKNIYLPEGMVVHELPNRRIKLLGKEIPAYESSGIVVTAPVVSNPFSILSFGEFTVEEYFGNWLDYQMSDIKIYLPFAGTFSLNPSDIVNHRCLLNCQIDLMTSSIVYNIIQIGNSGERNVLYTFNGVCGHEVPITSIDYSGKVAANISTAASIASTLGTAALTVATEGVTTPLLASTITGAVSSIASQAQAQNSIRANRTSSITGLNGVMSPKSPYLIITRPKMILPEAYGEIYGFPSGLSARLSELPSGYCKVKDMNYENMSCTDDELKEIDEILKSGFIM